jgi:hypothetical protein
MTDELGLLDPMGGPPEDMEDVEPWWETTEDVDSDSDPDDEPVTKRLIPVVLKGDSPGHEFHGNQYTTTPSTSNRSSYEPDHSASENGDWDWSSVKNRGELNQQGDPKWRQSHQALVVDAVHAWAGDPVTVTPQMVQELHNEPMPDSGSGKQMRARGAALLWELQHKARSNPIPLYRGDTHTNPSSRGLQAWSEDKRVAALWARKSGGTVVVAPPGSLKGLRSADYVGEGTGEKEWIICREDESVVKGDSPGHEFRGNQYTQAEKRCWSCGGSGNIFAQAGRRHSKRTLRPCGICHGTGVEPVEDESVVKGDSPGHEFHGNQYTSVGEPDDGAPDGPPCSHYVKGDINSPFGDKLCTNCFWGESAHKSR